MYKMLFIISLLFTSLVYADSQADSSCPPPVCGIHEKYYDCTPCKPTCETRGQGIGCAAVCTPGCACDEGYIRESSNGPCILPSECPPNSQCKGIEVYVKCKQTCPPQTCNSIGKIYDCPLQRCEPGCQCPDGYLRNGSISDPCIPKELCPTPIQCKAHEIYSECKKICPPQTCASKYIMYDCVNNIPCEPGCDCEKGYLRNGTVNDPCIKSELCPPLTPICGENEKYYDCTPCKPTCETRDQEISCAAVCEPGCACDEGYIRDSSTGSCVLPSQCPPTTQCNGNEVYVKCKQICPPQTCYAIGKSFSCPADSGKCEPGCQCPNGYLRNGTTSDPCIPEALCPHSCGEHERFYECIPCKPTCATKDQEIACTAICNPGCACDEGYIRERPHGRCVLPSQCPIQCKSHEVYRDCKIICPPQTCASIYTLYRCMDNIPCEPGCDCEKGYLRNGTVTDPCIKSELCPSSPVDPCDE